MLLYVAESNPLFFFWIEDLMQVSLLKMLFVSHLLKN